MKTKTISVAQLATKVFGIAVLAIAVKGVTPTVSAQERDTTLKLDEVIISASRADNKTPLTTSTLDRRQLEEQKIAVSLPYMLELEPSVVTTSENGQVGVTSMRIRGVDATRINVNINGIPLNDAESQSVYWYNIPSLGSMSQSVQLQRGVGASNGGSAAFGGAMNLQTLNTASHPYGTADLSWGSWNTRQYGIMAGSGLTKHGFSVDAAYNGLTSDGFIRGGQTDQQSLFLNAGWYGTRTMIKAIAIIGEQHSGITWDGASAEDLDLDPRYNGRGAYKDQYGNLFYYPNETDNYKQQHYQLYFSHLLNDAWSLNAALDYTHGFGYTESYKDDKKVKNYGHLGDIMSGITDLIVNKNMGNDAYTANFAARYQRNALTMTLGANYQLYAGMHWGEILWADRDTVGGQHHFDRDHPFGDTNWYLNTGLKHDAVAFAKFNYDFSDRLNLYADLQLRSIIYDLHGTDDDYGLLDYDTTHLFFNPKVGVNYRMDENQRAYFVAGVANREPTRADIKEAVNAGRQMRPETMLDLELGYQLKRAAFHFEGNLYAMLYKDQLTPNGFVTDSYYALMDNVEKSYRLGIELVAGYRLSKAFSVEGNLTLSTNKAINYTADLRDVDWTLPDPKTVNFGTTDLALSPSVVGAAMITYRPCSRAKVQLVGKYVGSQYADNTGRDESKLDPYFLLNLRGGYTFKMGRRSELELQAAVNNLLNTNYRTSASCGNYYNFATDEIVTSRLYFQQPGRNFTIRALYRF